jgi:hypothetical protein
VLLAIASVAAFFALRFGETDVPTPTSSRFSQNPLGTGSAESLQGDLGDGAITSRAGGASQDEISPDAAEQAAAQAISEIYQSLATQRERRARLRAAFATWHKVEPELAPKLMTLLAERFGVTLGTGDLVWTVEELERAGRLVSTLEKSEDRLPFLSEIARHLAQVDPGAGMRMAEAFKDPAEREQFIGEVLEGWTVADPDQAVKWAVATPSGPAREAMLDRIVQGLVATSPSIAAHVVATGFEEAKTRENAARTVIGRWAFVDAPAAGQWLEKFPAGELRSDLLRTLIITWQRRDPEALGRWLTRLKDPALRAQAGAVAAEAQ